ncbi:MAG: hypothetical protein ACYC27_02925 [Armatimonadota bacterium]
MKTKSTSELNDMIELDPFWDGTGGTILIIASLLVLVVVMAAGGSC